MMRYVSQCDFRSVLRGAPQQKTPAIRGLRFGNSVLNLTGVGGRACANLCVPYRGTGKEPLSIMSLEFSAASIFEKTVYVASGLPKDREVSSLQALCDARLDVLYARGNGE